MPSLSDYVVPEQEDYLAENSPAVLGAEYFIVPPPGLFAIKASHLIENMKSLPRSPRSLKLSRALEARKQEDAIAAFREKRDRMQQQLRFRKIDEARCAAQRQIQNELMFGSLRLTTTNASPSAAVSNSSAAQSLNTATIVRSAVTSDARSYLSALHAARHSTAQQSPMEKRTDSKIEDVRQGKILLILPPKESKKSRNNQQQTLRPTSRQLHNNSRGSRPGTAATMKEEEDGEDEDAKTITKSQHELIVAAGKQWLSYFAASRYVLRLRQIAKWELTADCFRKSPSLMKLLESCQGRLKVRARRNALFKILIARARVIAIVARYAKRCFVRKRRLQVRQICMFLSDCISQCKFKVLLRLFKRKLVTCQRVARHFIACSRERVKVLLMKLQRLVVARKAENDGEEADIGDAKTFDILKRPKAGRRLIYAFLAKLRKYFAKERKDYLRRLHDNDTTPQFAEIDIHAVREFLLQDEAAGDMPPQYSGQSPHGGPIFKLFSRKHIDGELLELLQPQNAPPSSSIATDGLHRHARKIKITVPPTKVKRVVKTVRRKKKEATDDSKDVFAAVSNEALALIKVIETRIRDRNNTSLL